jgi:hypothetical protein
MTQLLNPSTLLHISKTDLDLSALIDHLQNAINDYQSKVLSQGLGSKN